MVKKLNLCQCLVGTCKNAQVKYNVQKYQLNFYVKN